MQRVPRKTLATRQLSYQPLISWQAAHYALDVGERKRVDGPLLPFGLETHGINWADLSERRHDARNVKRAGHRRQLVLIDCATLKSEMRCCHRKHSLYDICES